jgi:hypothetical protein
MKANSILIAVVIVLLVMLSVLSFIAITKKDYVSGTPEGEKKVESVPLESVIAGAGTPVITVYKQNSGSIEKTKKEFIFESGKCNPDSVEITAPGFVTLVNRENQDIIVSDTTSGTQRSIKQSESTGVFLQRAGVFTFTSGSSACSVTVK